MVDSSSNFKGDSSSTKNLSLIFFYAFCTWICYLLYGIFQEELSSSFPFGVFIVFTQSITNSIMSYVILLFNSRGQSTKLNIPWKKITPTAISYISAMAFSNAALQYLSYPTQVVLKTIKMIPVMIISRIFLKRKYNLEHWLTVTFSTLGLMLFLKKSGPQNEFSSKIGYILVGISLMFDGFTGNLQEKIFQNNRKLTTFHLLFSTNCIGGLILFIYLIYNGTFINSCLYIQANPKALKYIILLCISSFIGQIIILKLIRVSSALVVSGVTTSRKFFSVLISIIIYKHELILEQWIGLVLVFIGVFVAIYNTRRSRIKEFECIKTKQREKLKDT